MNFLEYLSLINLLEFLAAISGTYYVSKTRKKTIVRKFVWFLWLTVFVEIVANYASVAYYSDYTYFSFVENTPFEANYWLYNIYSIIAFGVYITFFTVYLKNPRLRKILHTATLIYLIAAVINLFLSDEFFKAYAIFTFFAGTVLVTFSIGAYYFELLRSDRILNFYKLVPFYISVGALVYHLAFVPLVIYSRYFNAENPEFIEIYMNILLGINYFLYSIYILGFLICSRKRKI
ncbi:MAG TPA: hypothetical protein VFI78_05195 [Salinimicrobium sp.]|nr:hypothetical protein [Salinimicrobium sp.]